MGAVQDFPSKIENSYGISIDPQRDLRREAWELSVPKRRHGEIDEFLDMERPLDGLSYQEKVASSLIFMVYALKEDNPKSRVPSWREKIRTSCDGTIRQGFDALVERLGNEEFFYIEAKKGSPRPHTSVSPYWIEGNCKNESTQALVKYLAEPQLQKFEEFFNNEPRDLLVPLSSIKAFPLFGLDKIIASQERAVYTTQNDVGESQIQRKELTEDIGTKIYTR